MQIPVQSIRNFNTILICTKKARYGRLFYQLFFMQKRSVRPLPPAGYFLWQSCPTGFLLRASAICEQARMALGLASVEPKKVTKESSSFARKTPRFARQTVRAKHFFHRAASRLIACPYLLTSTSSYPSTMSPTWMSLKFSMFRPHSRLVPTSFTSSLNRLSDPRRPV